MFADKFKLDEVLRNLISNALKYSSRNSMISVRVGFQPIVSANMANVSSQSNSPSKNVVQRIRSVLSFPQNKVMDVANDDPIGSPKIQTGDNGSIVQPGGRRQSIRSFIAPLLESLNISRRSNNNKINVDNTTCPEIDIVGSLIVVVTDIGVGISKENQKLIFQEGMQFDPEKLQTGGGSGFGKIARPINTSPQHTLSTYSLNTTSQRMLSNHPLNTTSQCNL